MSTSVKNGTTGAGLPPLLDSFRRPRIVARPADLCANMAKSSSRKSLRSLFSRSEANLAPSPEKDADKSEAERKKFKFLKLKIKSKKSASENQKAHR